MFRRSYMVDPKDYSKLLCDFYTLQEERDYAVQALENSSSQNAKLQADVIHAERERDQMADHLTENQIELERLSGENAQLQEFLAVVWEEA